MKVQSAYAIVAIAVSMSASFAAESAKQYVPVKEAAAKLADGKAWSAVAPDGKTLKITLSTNGTGNIKGPFPFTLSVSWEVKGEEICISGKMDTRCLKFTALSNGLQGWDGDKADLTFSR